ncbi:hypothetical protein E2C01_098075 [Portunus trituberculatus]|uniref:Uncharacterized protein n=1 Tax=Portunus trituberculatus TaxID=210409 RepID=A0A5B7KB83_PORTR|nr:hypothetical protein [Portunus trituberculatus]
MLDVDRLTTTRYMHEERHLRNKMFKCHRLLSHPSVKQQFLFLPHSRLSDSLLQRLARPATASRAGSWTSVSGQELPNRSRLAGGIRPRLSLAKIIPSSRCIISVKFHEITVREAP